MTNTIFISLYESTNNKPVDHRPTGFGVIEGVGEFYLPLPTDNYNWRYAS